MGRAESCRVRLRWILGLLGALLNGRATDRDKPFLTVGLLARISPFLTVGLLTGTSPSNVGPYDTEKSRHGSTIRRFRNYIKLTNDFLVTIIE